MYLDLLMLAGTAVFFISCVGLVFAYAQLKEVTP
jgi:hypothetical protein